MVSQLVALGGGGRRTQYAGRSRSADHRSGLGAPDGTCERRVPLTGAARGSSPLRFDRDRPHAQARVVEPRAAAQGLARTSAHHAMKAGAQRLDGSRAGHGQSLLARRMDALRGAVKSIFAAAIGSPAFPDLSRRRWTRTDSVARCRSLLSVRPEPPRSRGEWENTADAATPLATARGGRGGLAALERASGDDGGARLAAARCARGATRAVVGQPVWPEAVAHARARARLAGRGRRAAAGEREEREDGEPSSGGHARSTAPSAAFFTSSAVGVTALAAGPASSRPPP